MNQVPHLATAGENRAHWAAWCIVSSPLILGALDVTDAAQVAKAWSIISNARALSVSQSFAEPLPALEGAENGGGPPTVSPMHPGGLVKSWTPSLDGDKSPSGKIAYLLASTGDAIFGWEMPPLNKTTRLRQLFPTGLCVDTLDMSGRGSDGSGFEVLLQQCNASSPSQQILVEPVNASTDLVVIRSEKNQQCLVLEGMNGPSVIWAGCGGDNSLFRKSGVPGGGTICNFQGSSRRCLSASLSFDPSGGDNMPTGIGMQMWAKPMPGGAVAVLVLNNRDPLAANVTVSIDMAEVTQILYGRGYTATEIWTGQNYTERLDNEHAQVGWVDPKCNRVCVFQAGSLGGHDSMFFLFTPRK
eukprot:SAG31_NODE_981_length_10558_cov_2.972273_6_plen_357_part_00